MNEPSLRQLVEECYRKQEQQKDWLINIFEVFGHNKYALLEEKVRRQRKKFIR